MIPEQNKSGYTGTDAQPATAPLVAFRESTDESARGRSTFSKRLILLVCLLAFLLIAAASLRHAGAVYGQNDASRWDTVWSLTNGKGYAIDSAPYQTIDKVYRGGHFYSSKPALLPAIVAGVTLTISKATGLALLPGPDYLLTRLVLLIVNCVPFFLFLYFYGEWLGRLPHSNFTKVFCLCSAAFGTFLTAYNITLTNHTLAALGVFFAMLEFMRIQSGESRGRSSFFLCGIFSAWAVANELIAWPFWFFVAGYLLKAHKSRTLRFFLPGTFVIASAFLISTYIAAGDFVPFYLKHRLYQYPGSYWAHPSGIDAAHESKLVYFFNHVLGHHGILSLSPIFIFAFVGMISTRTPTPLRAGAIVLTAVNLLFVVFKSDNYGGACQGPRWFMWLIPLWLLCMPASADKLAHSSLGRVLAILTLLVSVGSVIYGMVAHDSGPWSSSWIQDCMKAWGWVSY